MLSVENLTVEFQTRRGLLKAIDSISFHVDSGETLGIVGESGCGKSITSLALMGLLPSNGSLHCKKMTLGNHDLTRLSNAEWQAIRGREIAMIFQDPMTSLNPSFPVEFQLVEALTHRNPSLNASELRKKALELLDQVGIPAPETRLKAYPHQLSGGMSQRIMIAMALAGQPKLLIADEPTTALDVTIQSQILDLLVRLKNEYRMALILITHDLGVVSEMADRIQVMYAGKIVESGIAQKVIHSPKHPYTRALLSCLPASHQSQGDSKEHRTRLPTISGLVPDLLNRPNGCQFNPRCPQVKDICREQLPLPKQSTDQSMSLCHFE